MKDYTDMAYFALKAECKKQGLSAKGKKDVLLERLGASKKAPEEKVIEQEEIASLPDAKPTQVLQATQEELNKYLPNVILHPTVDISRYEPWLTSERLEVLENKLKPIFAAKGSFKLQLDYEKGSFGVEFDGGAAGKEYTTIIVEDNFLIQKAMQYCSRRLAKGGDGQVTTVK